MPQVSQYEIRQCENYSLLISYWSDEAVTLFADTNEIKYAHDIIELKYNQTWLVDLNVLCLKNNWYWHTVYKEMRTTKTVYMIDLK